VPDGYVPDFRLLAECFILGEASIPSPAPKISRFSSFCLLFLSIHVVESFTSSLFQFDSANFSCPPTVSIFSVPAVPLSSFPFFAALSRSYPYGQLATTRCLRTCCRWKPSAVLWFRDFFALLSPYDFSDGPRCGIPLCNLVNFPSFTVLWFSGLFSPVGDLSADARLSPKFFVTACLFLAHSLRRSPPLIFWLVVPVSFWSEGFHPPLPQPFLSVDALADSFTFFFVLYFFPLYGARLLEFSCVLFGFDLPLKAFFDFVSSLFCFFFTEIVSRSSSSSCTQALKDRRFGCSPSFTVYFFLLAGLRFYKFSAAVSPSSWLLIPS